MQCPFFSKQNIVQFCQKFQFSAVHITFSQNHYSDSGHTNKDFDKECVEFSGGCFLSCYPWVLSYFLQGCLLCSSNDLCRMPALRESSNSPEFSTFVDRVFSLFLCICNVFLGLRHGLHYSASPKKT